MTRIALLVAMVLPLGAVARADGIDFPAFDVAKSCREQADYAFAATLGQVDVEREIKVCADGETTMRDQAAALWSHVSATTQRECRDLADRRYRRIDACLEDAGRHTAR